MRRSIVWTNQFKKDYKLSIKRGFDIGLLDNAIRILADGNPLPVEYKDHQLSGNWKGYRECHIQPDWFTAWKKIFLY